MTAWENNVSMLQLQQQYYVTTNILETLSAPTSSKCPLLTCDMHAQKYNRDKKNYPVANILNI